MRWTWIAAAVGIAAVTWLWFAQTSVQAYDAVPAGPVATASPAPVRSEYLTQAQPNNSLTENTYSSLAQPLTTVLIGGIGLGMAGLVLWRSVQQR